MQHESYAQSLNTLMRAATSPGVSLAPHPAVAHQSPYHLLHHHHHLLLHLLHHHHHHQHQCDEAVEDGHLPAVRLHISPHTKQVREPFIISLGIRLNTSGIFNLWSGN